MSDRSFVRSGGLAGVLLALTAWAAVASYYTLARRGEDLVGIDAFRLLCALVAFWGLFGVFAAYWVARANGEAWSFFAMLVGVSACVAAMIAFLHPIAFLRDVLGRPIDPLQPLPSAIAPTDPLNVVTFGLVGLWSLVTNLVLWRSAVPRRLAALGILCAAVLLGGFVARLGAQDAAAETAALAVGAAGGPLYWLWLGLVLRRLA